MGGSKSSSKIKDRWIARCRNLESATVYIAAMTTLMLGLIIWAGYAEIDRVVRVDGKIIPTGHSRLIQHLEGGIVSDIPVHEGQIVKKGDTLLLIDATMADANLNETTSKLSSQRAKAARLKAEAAMANEMICPEDINSKEMCEAEKGLFAVHRKKLDIDLQVGQETIKQRTAELNEIKNRRINLSKELTVAQKKRGILAIMAQKRAASQMELLEAQGIERRYETEIKDAESALPKTEAALAAEQAKVGTSQAEYRATAQTELVAVLAEMDRLSQTLASATDRVKRTEIKAPIDGIINRMQVTTIGEVVKPGESVVELTPASDEILVEVKVPPKDRGELRPGLAAKLKVTAYDYASLGSLAGSLAEISADTMQDQKGEAYYNAKIKVSDVPGPYLEKPLLPGMTVSGDIVTGRRTFLGHLISPLSKFTNNMFRDAR